MKIILIVSFCIPFLSFGQQDQYFIASQNPVVQKVELRTDSDVFSKRVKYIGLQRSSAIRDQLYSRLLLFNDGTVEYFVGSTNTSGIPNKNISVPRNQGKLSPLVYEKIAQFIIENRIAELADQYQTGPDNSTLTSFAFEVDGTRKVIRIQTTVLGPPILWALQEIMQDVPNRVIVTGTM